MSNYNLSSVQTTSYLLSDGTEQPHDLVRTAPSNTVDLNIAVVTISPPVSLDSTCVIQGKAGLYASVGALPESGQAIVWTGQPYRWQIARTAQGTYEIYIPGQDFYWFGEEVVGNGPAFVIRSGSEAKEKEIFFNIAEV